VCKGGGRGEISYIRTGSHHGPLHSAPSHALLLQQSIIYSSRRHDNGKMLSQLTLNVF